MKRVRNARELRGSLEEIREKTTDDQFLKIIKKLAFDGFSDLVSYTPFDTGYASSNWRVGINEKDEMIMRPSGSGGSFGASNYGSPAIKIGDVVNLYNNTVYIGALDAGWSRQEPRGMIAPTFQRMSVTAARLTASLSKERVG